MIDNFCLITSKGNPIKVRITRDIDYSLFESATDAEYKEYINNNPQGLKWEFQNKEIKFFENPFSLFGLPTPQLDKVILIYPYDHPKYKAPQNAVIYNDDGSIYMQLKIPELISSTAKERKSRIKKFNPMNDAYFRGVYWSKDGKGNLITVVSIDFDWEWWESRVLNPETGEFGECIDSGRR